MPLAPHLDAGLDTENQIAAEAPPTPLAGCHDRFYFELSPPFPNEPTRARFRVSPTTDGKGEGLQSLVDIRKGQAVFVFHGHIVTEQSLYTLQAEPGRYVLDPLVMGKVLHACAPNMHCDMSRRLFTALRDIAAGEWLTMDYETTEDVLSRSFTCGCGAPACRGLIRGRAYRCATASIQNPMSEGTPMIEYKRIVVDGVHYYGKHTILSATHCSEALLSKEAIAEFLPALARRIDMVPFGAPFVERFGQGIEIGVSGVQLIETSAITIHTNDGARDLYLDVFSCKDFDPADVEAAVRETFCPGTIDAQTILRK